MDYTAFNLTMRYIDKLNRDGVNTYDAFLNTLWCDMDTLYHDYLTSGFDEDDVETIFDYVTGNGCAVIYNYFRSLERKARLSSHFVR